MHNKSVNMKLYSTKEKFNFSDEENQCKRTHDFCHNVYYSNGKLYWGEVIIIKYTL